MPRTLNAQRLTPNALLVVLLLMLVSVSASFAQIVAVPNSMSFQGRLAKPDGTPVPDGTYSIRFRLYDALTGGNVKFEQTSASVPVKNGVFVVLLSGFPSGTFNGDLWLGIKIGTDAELTPRPPLISVAYAFKAGSVVDGSITGASLANGTITADKFANNLLNPLAWLLNGNSGVTSGFLGTTDNNPLEFRVNNHRAMRYIYAENTSNPGFEYRSINVLGGSEINSIAAGVVGATIAGGGFDSFTGTDYPNSVTSNFGTIGGGVWNTTNGPYDTIAGGDANTASNDFATVGGGTGNFANGSATTVAGGYTNIAMGDYATVAGGYANIARSDSATVGGGFSNIVNSSAATIAGGSINTVSGFAATVAGGSFNTAAGSFSFAAGQRAQANHDGAFVWADSQNANFVSTGIDQFLIRAQGGVGINTSNPTGATLRVTGGRSNVGVFAGDLAPFGTAAFESNLSSGAFTAHIWCANNGAQVFYVLGDGSVYGTGPYNNLSDGRYKTHVETLPTALDTILHLRGVTFEWDRARYAERVFPVGRQIGFIAQEVEQVLPELVRTDQSGSKSVAYANVVPVLVEAVKTLNGKVEMLQKDRDGKERRIGTLEKENAELKAVLADVLKRLDKVEAGSRR